MEAHQKMTHTQSVASLPLNLYVCFNPTFSLHPSTDLAQGCWAIVARTDAGYVVHTRGCDDQSFHLHAQDGADAAWALKELLLWQWKHGLRAVPESRAPLSAFLTDERDAKPWAAMRRLFERTVHVRDLQGTLADLLRLQRGFSLPQLVAV